VAAVAAGWGTGWFVWRRRCVSDEQLSAAKIEARSAASRADAALAEERRRIARELHDVVSHAVTVVVLQARGGRTMLDRDPHQTRAALDAIETSGQQALAEMRRLVTLLREPGVDTTPQPGIRDLEGLIAGAARSVNASLRVQGDPAPVSPGVGLTVFRLVQECLTNALRHSPGAAVGVDLDYGPRAVAVTVRSANCASAARTEGSGHGLIGMRERVELYGGALDFGEVAGCWVVSGTIPYTDLEGAPSTTLVATSPGLDRS
jgi:signal transduction histidine kinase